MAASFWMVEGAVVTAVQDALRATLRDHQVSIAQLQAQNEHQSRRYLHILDESAPLKASLRLMLDLPGNTAARLTVEDQLHQICGAANIELLVVSSSSGATLAGVARSDGRLAPIDPAAVAPPMRGLFLHGGSKYQMTSVPLKYDGEHVALVAVGERLDFARFNTPVLLLHKGRVVESSLSGVRVSDLQRALANCRTDTECELDLPNSTFLSLATRNGELGDGYSLRSLVDLKAALRPVQRVIRKLFLLSGAAALAAAVIMTAFSSWSIVKPIARVISHLRDSEKAGKLRKFDVRDAGVHEVRELMDAFNRTASAMQVAERSLHTAYVEFVGSLASALDARDPYTAGHSTRVAEYSCAIAEAMNLGHEALSRIRIGALLHDIGKIGIPDSVLRKPFRLTDEEFALIREHPAIGRRILEGVNGFAAYLDIVELHHENWDGSGYPHGHSGESVPLDARIVHVADAYDAMTSDRPYRSGMKPEAAMAILAEHAGAQFDPRVVAAFARLRRTTGTDSSQEDPASQSLARLAAQVRA